MQSQSQGKLLWNRANELTLRDLGIYDMSLIRQILPERPTVLDPSLQFLKQTTRVDSPCRQDRPLMIERVINRRTSPEALVDAMSNDLDVVVK